MPGAGPRQPVAVVGARPALVAEWTHLRCRALTSASGAERKGFDMRKLWSLFAIAVLAVAFVVATSGPAAALGGETLGCRIVPVLGDPPFTSNCTNHMPATTYGVGFVVSGLTGTYTFTWHLPAGYTPVSGFCGNFDQCAINVSNANQTIRVSVTLTQNGSSETLNSLAVINEFCGSQLC
jgi:hypothetical protein